MMPGTRLRLSIYHCRRRYVQLPFLIQAKFIHEASSPSLELDLCNPTFMIWGSNTGVGKTLVSTGIAASVLSASKPSHCVYVKPVQTGFPLDSDSRFVYRKVSEILRRGKPRAFFASDRVLNASNPAYREVRRSASVRLEGNGGEGLGVSSDACYEEETTGGVDEEMLYRLTCLTFYGWKDAVSPHIAVEREGMPVDDSLLRGKLSSLLMEDGKGVVWRLVETAGGVASPGPSGSLQCDLYRHVYCSSLINFISIRYLHQWSYYNVFVLFL